MTNEHDEIVQTLTQIYSKNIAFLKKYHPSVYNQITEFKSLSIANYFIDFENNHFELFDKSGEKTYNCDPFYDANYRVQNLDKNISGITTIKTEPLELLKETPYDAKIFVNQFIKYIEKQNISNLIYQKFIFVGTLLGVHLNDIAKSLDIKAYLIVEDSIEIFRLSLFLTDYEQLSLNSKLFFAINKKDIELELSIREFLNYEFKYNAFIKYEIASEKHIPLLEKITNIISTNNTMIYPYSEYMENYKNCLTNYTSSSNGILNIKTLKNILDKKPILFIASGPSLKDDLKFIKENQNRYNIVCVLSALKKLEQLDIIPDIIITIDGNIEVENSLSNDNKYYKESIIIASTSTHHKVLKRLNSKNCFLIQTNFSLFDEAGFIHGISVGDTAVDIILTLGSKEIYLAGFDAALDQDTGATHTDMHSYQEIINIDKSTLLEDQTADYADKTLHVKGNLRDTVITTLYYNTIIKQFDHIKNKLITQKIYNLSNGAYLNGTIPMYSKDIDTKKLEVIDKVELKNSVIEKLQKITKHNLTKEDKLSMDLEKSIISNFSIYKNNKDLLSNSLFGQIILHYYILIEPYKQYILNNINNDLEKELTALKENQLNIIVDYFKDL